MLTIKDNGPRNIQPLRKGLTAMKLCSIGLCLCLANELSFRILVLNRTCLEMIADQPHSLSQSPLEKDFEAGVHFGIGGFNLVSGTNGRSVKINSDSASTHWI